MTSWCSVFTTNFCGISPFTCPECNGVLTMLREDGNIRFRCHTGHALSTGTLLESTTQAIEDKLWDALRAVDETVMLLNKLGEQFAQAGNTRAAEQCFDKAREAHERGQPIRQIAMQTEELSTEDFGQAAG